MSKGIRTDKLDSAAAMLEDCIVGFFSGNSIQTTTSLSFAVMTVVRDLNIYYENILKVSLNFTTLCGRQEADSPLKLLFQKSRSSAEDYNSSLIDRANFVKHASKDPLSDMIFIGNEDSIILSVAIEDFGNFQHALKEKGLCCHAAELLGLRTIQEPKFFKLARLFYQYQDEYDNLSGSFDDRRDYEALLMIRDELKRKYHDVIHKSDLAKGRSQSDQLVLLDSLNRDGKPKPDAPAQSPL